MKFILGKKLKMGQIWVDKKSIPVTIVEAGPCFVTQIKSKEKDGYEAVQLGFDKIEKAKNITKTNKTKPYKVLREFRSSTGELQAGVSIDASIFAEGEIVDISGTTKGKGYQGGTKRYGFRGAASATHGNKHNHRTRGSVGCRWPQRVIKGMRMPGHMGFITQTTKNLKIVKIDKENNLLAIKGCVPGNAGTILEIVAK